ncbi:MAG: AraC family transcriptional regulator [Clostridia bacterium]|nr:AraC family transcriptional regulator [Clostridia bacterium]
MKRYHLIATDSVQVPKIDSIGFADDPRITRYGPSVRNQYIIHYVLSGKGHFNGNRVAEGEGFLIVPGMREEYDPDEKDPWKFLWIISEDPAMQVFFSRHGANEKTGIFKFYNKYEFERIVNLLTSAPSSFSTTAQLSEMFLHIFNACVERNMTPQSSVTKIYFNFAVNYIKTNLPSPISVAELCDAIGITQPYLYKIFKKETKMSPKQYISSCKIFKAKELLAHTELSISLVAKSVGYENVLDFSKFFSKQTNLSPTVYRNTCC